MRCSAIVAMLDLHWVQNALDHRRKFFKRIALFVRIGMPIISPLNAGDDVSKHAL